MSPSRNRGSRPGRRTAALAERLPAYMVPAAVVVLEAWPLTVNGKLDTRALPAPEYQDADRYRAPATRLRRSWPASTPRSSALERVGVDDSFFDLGGDSILSMQVVARARAAGVLCRPARHFRRADRGPAGPSGPGGRTRWWAAVIDEGVGELLATPIMRWLHNVRPPGWPGRAVQPDGGGAGPRRGHPRRRGGGAAGPAGSPRHAAAARRRRRRRRVGITGARGRFGRRRRVPAHRGRVVR